MIILSDQLYISLPLPEDARLANVDIVGNTVIVETKAQYLARVDYLSRFIGQEVNFLSPPATYGIDDFVAKLNTQEITFERYCFEDGTQNEYFLRCTYCSGGGDPEEPDPGCECFDPTATIIWEGDNIHKGDEVFEGNTTFDGDVTVKNITYGNDFTPITWTTEVTNEGDLTITSTECPEDGIIFSCEGITVPGVIIPGTGTCFVLSDGTTDCNTYLTEYIETDPVFTEWYDEGNFTVRWDQLVNIPDFCEECGGGTSPCDLTEQDCVNIKNLPGDGGGSLDCVGLLHNELDGLQGGDALADPTEFYHLTEAEHTFLEDLIANGSGVLTLHSELSDVTLNLTHAQIDAHTEDTTIHFLKSDVVETEVDPVFTAERDALTDTYVTMKGPATLIDSPMRIDADAYHMNDLPIWAAHGNSNTSFGSGNGQGYDGTAFNNVAIGALAGAYIFDGVTENAYASFGIYLGNFVKPLANNNTNETIIGNNIVGNGSNTVTIGNANVTDNYFNGNINIPGIFSGAKVEYGDIGVYVTSDIDGNMIFKDGVVEREYTLTELLGGAGGGWNLTANNDVDTVPIVLDNTVSFNGDADILTERVEKDINISLIPTGVNAGVYASPNLTIDANGRVLAAEDAGGCQQAVLDLGTQITGTHLLDFDNFPNAVIDLSEGADVTIDFRHVVDGDTGHIEVTHGTAATLQITASLAGKLVHIASNCRLSANTLKLSPTATIDVVAYWVAKERIHLAVIYDSIN